MRATDWALRAGTLVVVAGLIVGLAAVAPLVLPSGGQSPSDPVATPEYDPGEIGVTPIPADETPAPSADGDGEVVVIDDAHDNDIERAEIAPLVAGIVRTGGRVRFHEDGSLNETLRQADALVVIDPDEEYTRSQVRAVRSFTRAGGRVVMFGEPDRRRISGGLVSTSITTRSSRLSTLASAYGVSLGTNYLYNVESNDGNYRHVAVEPGPQAGELGPERAAMYTAAPVSAPGPNGRVLLRTAPETVEFSTERTGQFPVMVRSGNVILAGDSTFVRSDRVSVADNEAILAHLVEFLIENGRVTSGDGPGGGATPVGGNETAAPDGDGNGDEDPAGTATATATAPPA
jgi:hypothetical protein